MEDRPGEDGISFIVHPVDRTRATFRPFPFPAGLVDDAGVLEGGGGHGHAVENDMHGRGARARRHLRAAVGPRRSAAQRREPVVESKIRGLGEWRPRRGRTPRRPDGERNCPGMARNCEFYLVFPTIRVGMFV